MRILLTGGGTGGHIYPALALYRYLKDNTNLTLEFLYVGTSQGLEEQLVFKEKIPFKTVSVGGLTRGFAIKNLAVLAKVVGGLGQSWRIIRKFRPQVVVGTGGYVCGPVVLMASLMGIPTVIHEQNAFPGITNKMLARFARRVCLTFSEAARHFSCPEEKIVVTGLPLRPRILKVNKEEAIEHLGLDKNRLTVLVTGGSQGAKSINAAMVEVVNKYKNSSQVQLLIITGQAGYHNFCTALSKWGLNLAELQNIIVRPYLDEMEYGLGAADLVISRAGATFLAEITAVGIPAILIPYPHAAENHQEYNAKAVVAVGGAIMIKDNELSGELLIEKITELIGQPTLLAEMGNRTKILGQPGATEKLAQVVLEAANTR